MYDEAKTMAYEETTRADTPMRDPESSIGAQLDILAKAQDVLSATVMKVVDHFAPVCRDPYPEPSEDGNKVRDMDRAPQSPITGSIAAAVARANTMTQRLSILLERSQL